MGMNLENQIPDGNGHLTTQNITDWLSGDETANLQIEYEQHCVRCAECQERVAMIRQAMQPDEEMVRSTEYQELLRIGEQAAMRVWKEQHESVTPEPQSEPEGKDERWLKRFIHLWRPSPVTGDVMVGTTQDTLIRRIWQQPALRLATVAVLLMAVSIPGYLYWQNNQPVNRAMASLRRAWDRNRPIETRVTGDFPYLPYMVTRSSDDKAPVNQAQLLAATADLAREVADRPTPRAKHALGRLHLLKEEFAEAETLLKEVVSEDPKNAGAYVDLASVYYERGVREDSLLVLAQAAENLKKATEISPKLAEAWFNLALCHERMVLPKQAQEDWKKYLELDSISPWAAEARAHLERLANPNKSFVAPERLAEDLLAAAASNDEEKFRRLVLNNFITAFNLGREDFLDKYLAARAAGDQGAAAKYLDVMRRTARLAKEEKAEHYLNDIVTFVANANQSVIGKVVEIRALLLQGDQSHEKSEYTNALSAYEKAVALAESIKDFCHVEQARYGSVRIYTPDTESPKQRRLERHQLRTKLVLETGERNHKVFYARSLLVLANDYGAAQLLSKKLEASVVAYKTARLLGDFDTSINALRFSGAAQADMGNYESAVANYFQAVRAIAEHSVSPIRRCTVYLRMANTFDLAVNPNLALMYQLESLDDCKLTDNFGLWLSANSNTGLYYALIGQNENAEKMFQESLAGLGNYADKLGQGLLRTELNVLLGDVYLRQSRIPEAIESYKTTLRLVTGTEQRSYAAMAHQGLASAWLQLRRVEEAEQELQFSIELAEEIRTNINDINSRSSFRYRKLNTYRTMMNFQATIRNDFEKAFYCAGLSQNRELFDTLAAQSEIKWESNKVTIESAASDEVPSLRDVQKLLPDGVQLVEYGVTDQQLLIWLVTNKGYKPYKVPSGSQELQQLCAEYLRDLQRIGNSELLNNKAAVLHSKLIKPLLPDLDANRILVIVPDGILAALPFASLFSPETGRYLIQDFAIVTAPSAAVLTHTLKLGPRHFQAKNESIMVLNNPKFDLQRFPSLKPLPATQQEEEKIGSYYPGKLWLDGAQATKRRLLQNFNRFDIIHLATHSIVNEYNPLLSAVILAADNNPGDAAMDENLRAFEIFKLHLERPRLVILSSCRSGLTVQSSGNGLGGLAHAFFKAGVPAVLASLWEVEDRSTAELMSNFHYYYRMEKQSFGQALRHAQLKMLESGDGAWKHPYFWAAFQLSGNAFTS